jgi:hypothetical protein
MKNESWLFKIPGSVFNGRKEDREERRESSLCMKKLAAY